MRTIVTAAVAAAAAGFAGVVHAGSTVTAAPRPSVIKQGGAIGSAPNVTKVPASLPPFVPVPYPNTGKKDASVPKVPKSPVQTKNKSTFRKSTGDEAGTAKGVVSDKQRDKVEFKQGAPKVKFEGKPLLTPLDTTGHDGKDANAPPGAQVAPSQTKVIVGQ